MDFEEFKEALVKDMKTALDFRLETNTEVEIKHNTKTNYSYEALNVRPEGAEVGVSIDCNKLYAAYTDGVDYRDIVAGMTDQLEKSFKKADFLIFICISSASSLCLLSFAYVFLRLQTENRTSCGFRKTVKQEATKPFDVNRL